MGLPLTGELSLDDVNVELGITSGTTIRMGSSAVRGLFERSSGSVGMQHGRGKANSIDITVSSNTVNLNLFTFATANGWDGETGVNLIVAAGVWLYSNNNSTGGLIIPSTMTGVSIVNNGNIIGMGGHGNGGSGGDAIQNSFVGTTITNNSGAFIAGGGGGGAGAYGGGGAGQTGALGSSAQNSGGAAGTARGVPYQGHGCSGATNNWGSIATNTHAFSYGYGGGGGNGAHAGSTGSFCHANGQVAYYDYVFTGASGGRALTGGTNVTTGNYGGFWGQSGNGGSTAGKAVGGTTVTMTNNGTIYGSVA